MQKIIQNISFGSNLKRLRKANNLSQEKLVAKMQLQGSVISRSGYSNIELGTRNLKVSDLIILQKIYNVPYEEFFKDIDLPRE